MAKTNYNLAKRQKEAARKARAAKKLDRRQGRTEEGVAAGAETAPGIEGQVPAASPDDKTSP